MSEDVKTESGFTRWERVLQEWSLFTNRLCRRLTGHRWSRPDEFLGMTGTTCRVCGTFSWNPEDET